MTDAPAARRALPARGHVRSLAFGVLAGFVLASAFGAGALLAYEGQYAERICPGVTVAGVDVAGLDRDAAAEDARPVRSPAMRRGSARRR